MPHFTVKCRTLQRKKGHSAVGIGAYMIDDTGVDPWTGTIHNKINRHEHPIEIIGFSHSDDFPFDNPMDVFKAVDAFEKRKDSTLGEEYIMTFQHELSKEQNEEIIKRHCEKIAREEGKLIVAALHWEEGNWHVHVFETDRTYKLNENNNEYEWGKKNNTKTAMRERMLRRRKDFAQFTNEAFEKAGLDERVDHRSYKDQGLDIEPTLPEGKNPTLDRLEMNNQIRERNKIRIDKRTQQINSQLILLESELSKAINPSIGFDVSKFKTSNPVKEEKKEEILSTTSSLKTETTTKEVRKSVMSFFDELIDDDMPQVAAAKKTAAKKAEAENKQEENSSPQHFKSLIEKLGMQTKEKVELKGSVRVASQAHTTPAHDATPTLSPEHYRKLPPKATGHGFSNKNREQEYVPSPSPWDTGPR